MKRRYEAVEATPEDFLDKVKQYWTAHRRARMSIIGWQRGDSFHELCEEHGGPKPDSIWLFEHLPLGKSYAEPSGFASDFERYAREQYLGSIDGTYRWIFDIYVWVGRHHLVFNPFLKRMMEVNLGIMDRLLGRGIYPSWIDRTLVLP